MAHRMRRGRATLLLAASLLLPSGLMAAEREHDAHEHGHGQLNVAIDGGAVEIELIAPGADIVGFEHAAESDADKAAVEAAVARLKDGASLFVFPAAAGCSLEEAEVESELMEEHGGHDGHGEHEDQAEHKEHAEHEEHGEAHAEFHAHYHFDCTAPDALDAIEVKVFERFPGSEELAAQIITGSGQGAATLTAEASRLDL